jgi:hypothetical protein
LMSRSFDGNGESYFRFSLSGLGRVEIPHSKPKYTHWKKVCGL